MFALSIENVGASIARPLGSDHIRTFRAGNARPYIHLLACSFYHSLVK